MVDNKMEIIEQHNCVKVFSLGIGKIFKYGDELYMVVQKQSTIPVSYVDVVKLRTGELTTFPISTDVVDVEVKIIYKVKSGEL